MVGYEERRAYSCLVLSCLPLISFDCQYHVASYGDFPALPRRLTRLRYLCIAALTASPGAYPLLRSLIFVGRDLVLATCQRVVAIRPHHRRLCAIVPLLFQQAQLLFG